MADYAKQGLLHDMFSRQANATPDSIAVINYNGDTITFQALNDITSKLANYLRSLGLKPDSSVGIYMERSLAYTIAYIAILKAGGAYMPIDVSYPTTLIEDIILDAKPLAICTEKDMACNISGFERLIVIDKDWFQMINKLEDNSIRELGDLDLTLDNLAYTVYSSGTTGKPKGIQCPHRGAVFSYHWRHQALPYTADDREACNVFFTWEMFRPLAKGIPLYIIPDNVIYDPRLLCEFIARHRITRMLFTPSLLEAVLDAERGRVTELMTSLRTIIFCGEVVTTGLLVRCIEALPQTRFINLYSISEAHDVACCDLTAWYKDNKEQVSDKKFCPVGKLLPGVHVVILDANLKPQPLGVPGEIYVGGPTLARGYLNRPELTRDRFITRPAGVAATVGERLYRSGDWGYLLSDGSFEICGRCDSMVKVRGYSVETAAVESALLELGVVKACVVLVLGDEGDDKYLVAYIVPTSSVTSKKDVRAALKKRLPFYMIPAHFVVINKIPIVAASGKLDKAALPHIARTQAIDADGQPSTPTEQQMATLWADVLDLRAVDVHESFFDLGGHSLLATKLLSKVHEHFRVELSVKDLFVYSTVALMSAQIDRLGDDDAEATLTPVTSLDLLQEVKRHDQGEVASMDISLRAFWRSMRHTQRWRTARVLLTGATGFLGAFLLRDLLLHTDTHVYCVVRALPDQKGTERLRTSLERYGILHSGSNVNTEQKTLEALFSSRVTAVKGDVGLVKMGIDDDDYTYLCTDIDYVIHAAAYVNLIYPYQALHGPNVLGTQNVLLFACTSKIKPLHYISTDAVFPHKLQAVDENYNMASCAHLLTDGYSQSKWVAEQLVLRAMERGLPATVYRLGNLSGDRERARWNPQDFTLLMLQGCLMTGTAPRVDWNVEMTPVDFVSSLVVKLTQQMTLGLGKIFHVINTQPIKSQWLFQWLSDHGYPLRFLLFDTWRNEMLQLESTRQEVQQLKRILDSMIKEESYFTSLTTYTSAELRKVLPLVGLSYPDVSGHLLDTYLQGLRQQRLVPRALEQPLVHKVVVVTGASSGIGAAIARALARAGAKVALAARRQEQLEAHCRAIQDQGGVALAVQCDVTDQKQVTQAMQQVRATLGEVDVLVNNAGVMYYTMMKNLQLDEWHKQIDINCKGTVNCIGAVLDGMLKQGHGHIINMSSDAGRRGFAGLAVYSGTKFFIEGLSQGMRHELAKSGVCVTCIQPGDVKTELLSHSTDQEAVAAFDGSGSTRVLDADDVARAVLYVASQPPHVAVNELLIEPREAPI